MKNKIDYHYTFYKVELDGRLTHKEHLNEDECIDFMNTIHGRFANVRLERSDGKYCLYTDDGEKWTNIGRGTIEK